MDSIIGHLKGQLIRHACAASTKSGSYSFGLWIGSRIGSRIISRIMLNKLEILRGKLLWGAFLNIVLTGAEERL